MSGAETTRWRSSWSAAAEAQWAAARAGKFKESAAQFLISSWQGDALSVRDAKLQQHPLNRPQPAALCAAHSSMYHSWLCCIIRPANYGTDEVLVVLLAGGGGGGGGHSLWRDPGLRVTPARSPLGCPSRPCSGWAKPSVRCHLASMHTLR